MSDAQTHFIGIPHRHSKHYTNIVSQYATPV